MAPARDLSQDIQQLSPESGGEMREDELDYAVVERVYGIAPPSPHRLRQRAHACHQSDESQD